MPPRYPPMRSRAVLKSPNASSERLDRRTTETSSPRPTGDSTTCAIGLHRRRPGDRHADIVHQQRHRRAHRPAASDPSAATCANVFISTARPSSLISEVLLRRSDDRLLVASSDDDVELDEIDGPPAQALSLRDHEWQTAHDSTDHRRRSPPRDRRIIAARLLVSATPRFPDDRDRSSRRAVPRQIVRAPPSARRGVRVHTPVGTPADTAQVVDDDVVVLGARPRRRAGCCREPRRPGRPRRRGRVSSRTSRASAASSVSPTSTAPPGRLHSPLSGSWPRLTSSTRSPSSTITAPTATIGRSGYVYLSHRHQPSAHLDPHHLTTTRFLRCPSNSA